MITWLKKLFELLSRRWRKPAPKESVKPRSGFHLPRCPKCHGRKTIRLWISRHKKTKDRHDCPLCGGEGYY